MFGKKEKTAEGPKRIDYKVLIAVNENRLMKKVDAAIAEGFDPLGGVAVNTVGSFVQAVARHNHAASA